MQYDYFYQSAASLNSHHLCDLRASVHVGRWSQFSPWRRSDRYVCVLALTGGSHKHTNRYLRDLVIKS